MRNQIELSEFVAAIPDALKAAARRYNQKENLLLPYTVEKLEVLSKSYDSVINKLYRINCIYNRNYPDEPKNGLINGENLFDKIEDVVRARIVGRYMDAPRFICEALSSPSEARSLKSWFWATCFNESLRGKPDHYVVRAVSDWRAPKRLRT